jgi:hypothetical protein
MAHLADQIERVLKFRLGLAGEADDEIPESAMSGRAARTRSRIFR